MLRRLDLCSGREEPCSSCTPVRMKIKCCESSKAAYAHEGRPRQTATESVNMQNEIEAVRSNIVDKVRRQFAIPIEEATPTQVYESVSLCVRDDVLDAWISGRTSTQRTGAKCLIYLSAEFLVWQAAYEQPHQPREALTCTSRPSPSWAIPWTR